MNTITKFILDFHTQYSQFFLTSDNGKTILTLNSSTDLGTGYDDRLTVFQNLLVVRTETYGHVWGEINILDNGNQNIDLDEYDHIVEGSLEVQSGILQVLDCPNSTVELEIKVKPGTYRVRVYSFNIADYNEDNADDYYEIEIWPEKSTDLRVLKRYIPIKK